MDEALERTIEWRATPTGAVVKMIDQRALPHRYVILSYTDYHDVAEAIRTMVIRGAPAIGAAAAFGLALAGLQSQATDRLALLRDLEAAAEVLRRSRPTAVNLFWAIDRMLRAATDESLNSVDEARERLVREAQRLADEDVEINRRMAEHGAALIRDGDTILHHCNTGALAAVDWGTALGVIRMAHVQGKRVHVLVDETRPRLQGARLTTWELMRWGVPLTLIADNAAGHYLRSGKVNLVLVGSDRTAANGDVANKIGTYPLAVLAKENGVPFYPVVPTSTIDLNLNGGDEIPIEERDEREVTEIEGVRVAPAGVKVSNPAFDVTPHRYVTGIVTENGIAYPPFEISLRRVVRGNE
ncbi:MAG TPA: S-methyl-5-thioribose-1-phosphate isomerase [Anaerolineae bacterium]|nr:S-methyl-5-thioribose-1-phosphate isomerase [Anaerolineae bacterium]